MPKQVLVPAKELPHVILGLCGNPTATVHTQYGLASSSFLVEALWSYTHVPLSDSIWNPKMRKKQLFSQFAV